MKSRLHHLSRASILASLLLCVLSLVLLPATANDISRPSRQQLLEQLRQQQASRTGVPSTPPSAPSSPAAPSAAPSFSQARVHSASSDIGTEIPDSEVPRFALSPRDISWLDRQNRPWQHLRTDHFVVHYDRGRKTFAAKVARLAESFYSYIAADLPPGTVDLMGENLSHIFVFSNAEDWPEVLRTTAGLSQYTVSFVGGQAMYLQEYGDSTGDKMAVLAHEMTHLVINRFLKVRLPLWLNEGIAEYYGEFAYRSVRGMGKKSDADAFPPVRAHIPLSTLLALESYPPDTTVLAFYRTSKYFVGFLRSKKRPPDSWNRFFAAVAEGAPAPAALLSAYPYPDLQSLEKAFLKFPH